MTNHLITLKTVFSFFKFTSIPLKIIRFTIDTSSLDYSNNLSFSRFLTVEHVSKGLVSIEKVPVEKESSNSKFFGQLCNSSYEELLRAKKTGFI